MSLLLWSNILILITAIVCLVVVYWYFKDSPKDIKATYLFALFLVLVSQVLIIADLAFVELIVEVLYIAILTFVYIILLQSIRHLKSEHYRYPYPFVFTPVFLLITYPFLYDINVLKEVIINLIEGGGIAVIIFLFVYHINAFKRKYLAYSGLLSFILAMILASFLSQKWIYADFLWPVFLSFGMILVTYSFTYLLRSSANK